MHEGPCTILSFLPTNWTSLPGTGSPGEMLKWQLSSVYKSNACIFILCSEVVMYKVWGLLALHVLRRVCVWAALGPLSALEESRILCIDCSWPDAYSVHVGCWGFLLVARVYVTADF